LGSKKARESVTKPLKSLKNLSKNKRMGKKPVEIKALKGDEWKVYYPLWVQKLGHRTKDWLMEQLNSLVLLVF